MVTMLGEEVREFVPEGTVNFPSSKMSQDRIQGYEHLSEIGAPDGCSHASIPCDANVGGRIGEAELLEKLPGASG